MKQRTLSTDNIVDIILGSFIISLIGLFITLSVYEKANPIEISDTKCQYMAVIQETRPEGKYMIAGAVGGFMCNEKMVEVRWKDLDPGLFNHTKELHLIHTEMGPFFSRKVIETKIFKDVK